MQKVEGCSRSSGPSDKPRPYRRVVDAELDGGVVVLDCLCGVVVFVDPTELVGLDGWVVCGSRVALESSGIVRAGGCGEPFVVV